MRAIARRIDRLESALPVNADPMTVDLQYIDSDGNVVNHNYITVDLSNAKYRGLPKVGK